MKALTKKGFTLAELLIVMAIVVVLAAVAIPTFGRQLETARETGDMEIIRSAYTEALTFAVLDAADGTLDGANGGADLDAPDILTFVAATTGESAKPAMYTIELAKMDENAKIRQNGPGWQYVNNQISGEVVADVVGAWDSTNETKFVTFAFEILTASGKDGNVRLTSDYKIGTGKDAAAAKDACVEVT